MDAVGWAVTAIAFAAGAATGFASRHALKRVIGLCLAQVAVSLGALALGVSALALVGLAAALATVALGCALTIRLHESYGDTDARTHDVADAASESEPP